MTNSLVLPIREYVVEGKRLGRHINHDERSLQYTILPLAAGTPTKTVDWQRVIPILDQGNLGSCTGNATVGCLGTENLYEALSADQQKQLNEDLAVKLYEQGTREDSYPGQYPPTDTGCDGLTLCKVAVEDGWTQGYQHPLGAAALVAALQDNPAMVGVNWYSDMDTPDNNGIVKVGGYVRGGHQFTVCGWNEENQWFKCANSWSEGWGLKGYFMIPFTGMDRLLKEQGDAQVILPLNQPAPTPNPPQPTPGQGKTVDFNADQFAALDDWAKSPHIFHKASVASKAWKAANGE